MGRKKEERGLGWEEEERENERIREGSIAWGQTRVVRQRRITQRRNQLV